MLSCSNCILTIFWKHLKLFSRLLLKWDWNLKHLGTVTGSIISSTPLHNSPSILRKRIQGIFSSFLDKILPLRSIHPMHHPINPMLFKKILHFPQLAVPPQYTQRIITPCTHLFHPRMITRGTLARGSTDIRLRVGRPKRVTAGANLNRFENRARN